MAIPSLIFLTQEEINSWSLQGLLQLSTLFTLIVVVWAWIKPLLLLKTKDNERSKDILAFKRNYNLFLPYFYSQSKVDTEMRTGDVCLGSKNARIEILTITNPLCSTCIASHFMVEELLKEYPTDIKIKIRFYVPAENREDPRTLVSERMLELYNTVSVEVFEQSLHEWFVSPYKSWLDKWGKCSTDSFQKDLVQQREWCMQHEVFSTPTMYINGRRFPTFYHPTDIRYMIGELIERESKNDRCEEFNKELLLSDA